MADSNSGLFVLAAISVLCAVIVHWRVRRYLPATIISAFAAALLFQLAAAWQLGYVDSFAPVAFVVSLLITTIIGLVVGLLFRASRRSSSRDET
ncbi:MAG: hypothetical protein QM719_07990 [Thermomonas sp.]